MKEKCFENLEFVIDKVDGVLDPSLVAMLCEVCDFLLELDEEPLFDTAHEVAETQSNLAVLTLKCYGPTSEKLLLETQALPEAKKRMKSQIDSALRVGKIRFGEDSKLHIVEEQT